MGHVEISRGIQTNAVGLVVDLVAFLGGQIGKHLHGTHLARREHLVKQDAVLPALRHQQPLLIGSQDDAVGVGQPSGHEVGGAPGST